VVQGANTYAFAYNGLNDRLQQTVNGNITTYVLDLNAGLTQVLSDGTNTYLYGNGRIAQEGLTTDYFLTDALGSVRQLANVSGAVTLARSYEPYGSVMSSAGGGTSIYGWTGEQTDNTGMVFLRARFYGPQWGRFLTADSWGGDSNQPMSYNAWLYTYANPINFSDPTGYLTCKDMPWECDDNGNWLDDIVSSPPIFSRKDCTHGAFGEECGMYYVSPVLPIAPWTCDPANSEDINYPCVQYNLGRAKFVYDLLRRIVATSPQCTWYGDEVDDWELMALIPQREGSILPDEAFTWMAEAISLARELPQNRNNIINWLSGYMAFINPIPRSDKYPVVQFGLEDVLALLTPPSPRAINAMRSIAQHGRQYNNDSPNFWMLEEVDTSFAPRNRT
jgi:RHS repeat-associated protein